MFLWALSHPPPRMEWAGSIQNKWELLCCHYGITTIKWVKQLKIDCHVRCKWSRFELSDARWAQGMLGESCCTSEKCWTPKLWKVLGCLWEQVCRLANFSSCWSRKWWVAATPRAWKLLQNFCQNLICGVLETETGMRNPLCLQGALKP